MPSEWNLYMVVCSPVSPRKFMFMHPSQTEMQLILQKSALVLVCTTNIHVHDILQAITSAPRKVGEHFWSCRYVLQFYLLQQGARPTTHTHQPPAT